MHCAIDEETYEFALYRSICFGLIFFPCLTVIPLSQFFFSHGDNGELSEYNIVNKHSL